jgi:spore photoproduct lyase
MWGETGLKEWWESQPYDANGGRHKKRLLVDLAAHLHLLRRVPKQYAADGVETPAHRERKPVRTKASDKNIFGRCPVASEKTVCCNLRTIDAVENCVFGCSYCTVQTFYTDEIVFDEDFAAKLEKIELEPDRFYHIGTGQASDSLAWGNRNGVLDALCRFGVGHPNVLLELKTKSDNVGYFLEGGIPPNVVCSWSLNTPAVIANEEHFTATFERRVDAARRVADAGVKVAFHFHPMVYYDGWDRDYTEAASLLMERFGANEVLFVTFGSVTLIKPVIRKIREVGNPTKILQMELVPDPHGKMTYPDDVKVEMFKRMYTVFEPWRDDVFMYLCMEKTAIWLESFGCAYETNEEFEADFGRRTMAKLPPASKSQSA